MYHEVDAQIIEMTCRQMGATTVLKVDGSLFFYEFAITDDISLSYYFNVNDKNEYNLHRVKPYRFTHATIHSEKEVIEFIKKDLARFRKAANSRNFRKFVDTVNNIYAIGEAMDDLFLNFNVSKDALDEIDEEIVEINEKIDKLRSGLSEIHIEDLEEPKEK